MRLLVMGDIHGEYTVMQKGLEKADYRPGQDLKNLVITRGRRLSVTTTVKSLLAIMALGQIKWLTDTSQFRRYQYQILK